MRDAWHPCCDLMLSFDAVPGLLLPLPAPLKGCRGSLTRTLPAAAAAGCQHQPAPALTAAAPAPRRGPARSRTVSCISCVTEPGRASSRLLLSLSPSHSSRRAQPSEHAHSSSSSSCACCLRDIRSTQVLTKARTTRHCTFSASGKLV